MQPSTLYKAFDPVAPSPLIGLAERNLLLGKEILKPSGKKGHPIAKAIRRGKPKAIRALLKIISDKFRICGLILLAAGR